MPLVGNFALLRQRSRTYRGRGKGEERVKGRNFLHFNLPNVPCIILTSRVWKEDILWSGLLVICSPVTRHLTHGVSAKAFNPSLRLVIVSYCQISVMMSRISSLKLGPPRMLKGAYISKGTCISLRCSYS